MTTNFLFAQSPNRKGNLSKHAPTGTGGVTGVTRPQGSLAQPKGSQGKPAVCCDPTTGNGQKVMVSRPAVNTGKNFGYMAEGKSWLK